MSHIRRVIEVYDALKSTIDAAPIGDIWHDCELWLGYRADITTTPKRVSVIRSNETLNNSDVLCGVLNSSGSIVLECQVNEGLLVGANGVGTIESRREAYLVLNDLVDACAVAIRETPSFAAIANPVISVEHDTDNTAPIYKAWIVVSEQSYVAFS